jgi:hypothetical protein
MKKFIVFLSFVYSTLSLANSAVDRAFEDFFADEKISSNHCGRNIHYFLNYLERRDVRYERGYVVSIHEDYGALNLFNARWGSREHYEDGESYTRSNYFFHVFAVIDGKAYDFSKNFSPNQDVIDYLTEAYLPKKRTQNVFFQGHLTPQNMKDKSFNLRMKIYSLEGYKRDYTDALYEGSFIELFKFYEGERTLSRESAAGEYSIHYARKQFNSQYQSQTYSYPSVIHNGVERQLIANGLKTCRALGYLGAVPKFTQHEVSDNKKFYDLYASLKVDHARLDHESIRISFKERSSVGGVSNQPLVHYAKQVSCTSLQNVLEGLEIY